MSLLRTLSIVIISFYSVMFYSWQNLLPNSGAVSHIAWAQEIVPESEQTTDTENIAVEEAVTANESDIETTEEEPKKESVGLLKSIGNLFLLDKQEEIVEKTPLDYYLEGLKYYQEERYNLAFINFSYAVEDEEAEKETRAYFWIGRMHHLGQGGKVNFSKAYEFYLLAYQAGDQQVYNPEILQDLYDKKGKGAGYLLGKLHHDGKYFPRDDVKALPYFQTDANKGHAEAAYHAGLIHYEGHQVEKSYLLAVEYLQKASAQNMSDAQVLLGRIYYKGESYIGKDPQRAIQLFKASALQKDMKGQYYLAGLYYVGDIVPHNYQRAKDLFEKSAAQNYAPSHYFLGQMYFQGKGVARDYQQALAWYEKAAELQHLPAMLRVAQFHELGYGVPEDSDKAIEHYKQAALLGSADARFQLAMMYYGIGGDMAKVLGLLRDAASNGHMMAQYNLGQFHRHGIGVTHDNLLAWVWFNIALNHGNQRAQQDVTVMQARLSPQEIQQGQNYLDNWLRDNKSPKS